jgi:tetratricopeptide (TPR) repeat protein
MNAAFLHRAELFLERKEWKNLIELAQGALSDSSNNTMAKYYLALGLLHTEKLEEAERCIDQCLSSMPTFPGFLFAKARIHLKKAEPASAQNIANYLLSKNPDNVDALLLMAKTHLKLMEIGKAWPYLNRALEIAPDNTEVHNCFVLAQTLSGETVSTAYVDYQLKSNPKNAQALIQKIDLLLDQQSYAEARDLALNTVSQHPANHEVITTAQNALLHHVYFHRAGLALWNWLYFDMKYFYPISFIILTVVFLFGFAGDYSDKGTFFHWLFLVMSIVCSPLVVLVFRKPIAFAHLYVWPSTKRFLFEDQKWAGFCILSLFVLSLGTGLTFLMNFSPERGLYLSAFFAFLTIPVYEYSNSITLNDPYPKARLAYLAVAAIGCIFRSH